MSDISNDILRRVLEAEKIERQSRPEPEKRKWVMVKCPSPECGYRFGYVPKKTWGGELRCPHCGETFKVSRLDDFVG